MYKREATILNPIGLHARPASDFVKCAANFKSDITIGRVSSEKTVTRTKLISSAGISSTISMLANIDHV